jgi:hypothetical protein
MNPRHGVPLRITTRLGNGIGLIALAASFALASPGVKVVQAQTLASQEPQAQCGAADPRRVSVDADLEAFLSELRSEQVRSDPGARADIVVLNNRGYNYGPTRVDSDALLAEYRENR